jgi:hypothetical protein
VCRAFILGAAFVVMENSKLPNKVCDAIYRAHRKLFPNRTLGEPFAMGEIRTLYRPLDRSRYFEAATRARCDDRRLPAQAERAGSEASD